MEDKEKMQVIEIEGNSKSDFFLSRIDRSVADNLHDIRKSFGEDAGIVKDFIVFISKNLKRDLFGYTKFTLKDFCKESGRNRQDLAKKHPYFVMNPKAPVPEYFGHEFVSVFDYALFNMLQKNIIFAKSYAVNTKNEIVQLKNFPILKDIRLNINRQSNTIKVYEIRISDEWLDGFISRYYTIETNGYPKIGKGRGGDGRKSLYLILQRTRHQLLSQKETTARFSVDYLSDLAELEVEENRFRKKSLKRILDFFIERGEFPLSYRFIKGNPSKLNQEEYWVEFDFSDAVNISSLSEKKGDHLFFTTLMNELKAMFSFKYVNITIKDETDVFQRWLTNVDADLDAKADILISSYYKAYNQQLTVIQAKQFIKDGFFVK
ncbi:hypothetical protein [Dyadobacter sediminis]|uniref:Uncharacterized protein n=1 Tax=Dyadobacter sediminis TaxID=1493691 RepID=A0A5R9KH35_9BACT|nr:hypothetical protein [Dyadobacter sediminis]TLU95453.1 hypothetical protein FEM55_07240 [Dyadobacter sediminis]GGC14913.1 hypothetical protein GCM10011325_47200 [Dyadobacter sediminis]